MASLDPLTPNSLVSNSINNYYNLGRLACKHCTKKLIRK